MFHVSACVLKTNHSVQFGFIYITNWEHAGAGMVRLAHAAQTSLFVQRLDHAIDVLVHNMVCEHVVELPRSIEATMEVNRKKLAVCHLGLKPEDADLLLTMLNTDWGTPLDQSSGFPKLIHICQAGCCSSVADSQKKLKRALRASIAPVFPVPLLYRWKFWDEAVQYCLRNLVCHGLFLFIWKSCMSDKADENLDNLEAVGVMDEDCPDASPALRQSIRMTKVLALLSEPGIVVTRCSN